MNLPSALTRIDSINLAAALTIGMTTLITLLIPFLFGYWCKRGVRNLVFISYRHDDVVTDIRDQLTSKFGKSAVFLDDKIKEGQHMRQRIKSTLSICGILLPAIGRAWLRETERLRVDPQDYVRMEIVGAKERNVPLIPIFIDGAKMPSPRELPSDLKDLPDIKGIEIRRGKLDEDCRDLIGRILQLLPRSYKIKYRIKRIGYSVSFAIIIILAALGAALAILVLFASGLL